MKKAYIIHKAGGDSTSDWIPWLNQELLEKGFQVVSPDMPDLKSVPIDEWVSTLYKTAGNPDHDTYFVGHGFGCLAIARYLSALQSGMAGGVFLVAPWTELKSQYGEEKQNTEEWTEDWIWWGRAKDRSGKFFVFYSENDKSVEKKDQENFGKMLGAKMILEEHRGHFTDQDDVTQIPSLLNMILEESGIENN